MHDGQRFRTSRWAITVSRDEDTRKGWMPMSARRMAALGGVVGVEGGEHQVSGKGRPYGQLGGFAVPYFTHHYFVRVLPQYGAKGAVEGKARPLVYLYLAYAVHGVLHRVFHRYHVDLRLVDLLQNGVESGGFAAARGAGYKDYAVGGGADFVHQHPVVCVKAQFGKAHHGVALVKNTDDYFFAVDCWQG